MHWPGIEPGSTAWEAAMLTTIPPMLDCRSYTSNASKKITYMIAFLVLFELRKHMTSLHWPGIEPGSTAWEAAMLTTIPPYLVAEVTLVIFFNKCHT